MLIAFYLTHLGPPTYNKLHYLAEYNNGVLQRIQRRDINTNICFKVLRPKLDYPYLVTQKEYL